MGDEQTRASWVWQPRQAGKVASVRQQDSNGLPDGLSCSDGEGAVMQPGELDGVLLDPGLARCTRRERGGQAWSL